jgi:hypothetical protein
MRDEVWVEGEDGTSENAMVDVVVVVGVWTEGSGVKNGPVVL